MPPSRPPRSAGKTPPGDTRAPKEPSAREWPPDVARAGPKRELDWDGIKRRIEGAFKAGKMTREEADAKYREIKQRMAGHHRR